MKRFVVVGGGGGGVAACNTVSPRTHRTHGASNECQQRSCFHRRLFPAILLCVVSFALVIVLVGERKADSYSCNRYGVSVATVAAAAIGRLAGKGVDGACPETSTPCRA